MTKCQEDQEVEEDPVVDFLEVVVASEEAVVCLEVLQGTKAAALSDQELLQVQQRDLVAHMQLQLEHQ